MTMAVAKSKDIQPNHNQQKQDDEEYDSADDALCEFLGLPSIDCVPGESSDEDDTSSRHMFPWQQKTVSELIQHTNDPLIHELVAHHNLQEEYTNNSICEFPPELSLSAELMRRLTDELVWGGAEKYPQVDRTYETIRIWKNGEVLERRTLTRLEHVTCQHKGWDELCNNYIRRCISAALGEDMVLYKTKLNIKPAGGSGFAPHLDTPSLRIALGKDGPQNFVTVMIAIDDMKSENGCLRIVKGNWNEQNAVYTIPPDEDGNPDAGGRAGAIPLENADALEFEDLTCHGGSIMAFNGWAPHRSSANKSNFARRAVFLTYNPASEGDFHEKYYAKMNKLRSNFRKKVGLTKESIIAEPDSNIDQAELDALSTIPRI